MKIQQAHFDRTESRTTHFLVRLSIDEKERFEKRCRDAGITQSDYFRMKCLESKPLRKRRSLNVNSQMLYQALGQLGKVGSNINQIAKQYNSGFSQATENFEGIRQDLQALRKMVRAALELKD